MSYPTRQLQEMTEERRPITYGVVKPGPEDDENGVLFVRGGDIKEGKVSLGNLRTITEDVSRPYSRTLLKGGEILISLVGNPGEVGIAPEELAGANIARQAGMIALRNEFNTKYVMYFLRSPQGCAQLFQRTKGAVQQVINLADLKTVNVPQPDPIVQERIAQVLSSYDGLLENNHRRIELLEEAARLLYREWFVNLRFPGHEHVKVVDGLPEGWTRPPLGSLAWLNMGQSPKSEFYNDIGEGLPFHQGVTNYGFRFVEDHTFSTNFTKLAEPGDILFSVRAPVGRINLTMNRMVLGRGLASLRSKSDKQSFLFYQLKNHFFKEDLIGGGAIYAATNKKELEALEVTQPTDDMVDSFEHIAQPIDAQIKALTLQNRELVRARDILLPRLMDGRLEV